MISAIVRISAAFCIALVINVNADSIPFTCDTPAAGFDYGLQAELQRQMVGITGVIGVNCCAASAYQAALSSGTMTVTLFNQGPCACVDRACLIGIWIGFGSQRVSRVTVMTNFGNMLLDTSFESSSVQTPLHRALIKKPGPESRAFLYDTRGAALPESDMAKAPGLYISKGRVAGSALNMKAAE